MSLIRPSVGWPSAVAPSKPGEWFVLRTKTRQERILARELNHVGITAYVVTKRESRRYAQRQVDVEVPLFGRVVFVHGSMDDIRYALSSGRVLSVARAQDQVGLQADFDLLVATLPASAAVAGDSDGAAHAKPSPAIDLHRDVIFRLRRQLDAPPEMLGAS
jgi:hypothetical protein